MSYFSVTAAIKVKRTIPLGTGWAIAKGAQTKQKVRKNNSFADFCRRKSLLACAHIQRVQIKTYEMIAHFETVTNNLYILRGYLLLSEAL